MALSLEHALVMGGILFAAGLVGYMTRRNLILLFLSIELMLTGVSLNFVAFSQHHGNYQGQIFVIFVLAIAASEAALALSLVVALNRFRNSLDINVWSDLTEQIAKPVVQSQVFDDADAIEQEFPKLTPAGLDPLSNPLSVSYGQENSSEPT